MFTKLKLYLHLKGTRHLFIAAERRIPRIVIETRQAASLEGQRIVVSIDSWPQHSKYPVVSTGIKEQTHRVVIHVESSVCIELKSLQHIPRELADGYFH